MLPNRTGTHLCELLDEDECVMSTNHTSMAVLRKTTREIAVLPILELKNFFFLLLVIMKHPFAGCKNSAIQCVKVPILVTLHANCCLYTILGFPSQNMKSINILSHLSFSVNA